MIVRNGTREEVKGEDRVILNSRDLTTYFSNSYESLLLV